MDAKKENHHEELREELRVEIELEVLKNISKIKDDQFKKDSDRNWKFISLVFAFITLFFGYTIYDASDIRKDARQTMNDMAQMSKDMYEASFKVSTESMKLLSAENEYVKEIQRKYEAVSTVERDVNKIAKDAALSAASAKESQEIVTGYLFNAFQYYVNKDYPSALKIYREAKKTYPENPAGYIGEADTLVALGKYSEAIEVFKELKEFEPENMEINNKLLKTYHAYGKYLSENGRREEAISVYSEAIKNYPTDPTLIPKRGRQFYYSGQFEKGYEDFETAINQNSSNPTLYYERAMLVNNYARQPEKALVDINSAISLNPVYADAYNLKYLILKGLGRIEEAEKAFDKALQLGYPYSPEDFMQ